jgi:hypothetical protein
VKWRPPLEDVLALLGLALLAGGLWWVHPPAALIVIGTLLIAAAWWMSSIPEGPNHGTNEDDSGS